MVFVRADLVDYWRLLAEAGIGLARHYILYPNPWPKIGHLARRWHAHPVFPFVPRRRAAEVPQQLEYLCGRIRRRAGPADWPRGEMGILRGSIATDPF
jgi:hypothetical protein